MVGVSFNTNTKNLNSKSIKIVFWFVPIWPSRDGKLRYHLMMLLRYAFRDILTQVSRFYDKCSHGCNQMINLECKRSRNSEVGKNI